MRDPPAITCRVRTTFIETGNNKCIKKEKGGQTKSESISSAKSVARREAMRVGGAPPSCTTVGLGRTRSPRRARAVAGESTSCRRGKHEQPPGAPARPSEMGRTAAGRERMDAGETTTGRRGGYHGRRGAPPQQLGWGRGLRSSREGREACAIVGDGSRRPPGSTGAAAAGEGGGGACVAADLLHQRR